MRELMMEEVDGWKEMVMPYGSTYKSRWDNAWFVVREFMQNAMDEHDELGIKDSPRIWKEKDVVYISDKGRGVGVNSMLLMETKKGEGLRGEFGEGIKWASLCALRLGMTVNIKSPSLEVEPSLVRVSLDGGEPTDLMMFRWRNHGEKGVVDGDVGDGEGEGGTLVTLGNYPEGTTYGSRFFQNLEFRRVFRKGRSAIGLSRRSGKLYVKDLYVMGLTDESEDRPSLFTYNLWDLELDPDRVQVRSEYSLKSQVVDLWFRCTDIYMIDMLYRSMDEWRWEAGIGYWASYGTVVNKSVWHAAWYRRYGSKAVVTSRDTDIDNKARFYSMKVVEVPLEFGRLLVDLGIPSARAFVEKVQESGRDVIPDSDLSYVQRVNLAGIRWICSNWQGAEGVSFVAATFEKASGASDTMAEYERKDGECTVYLGLECLEDIWEALKTVCHEMAHHISGRGDGDPNLVFAIEDVAARMFRFLRRNRYATEWSMMVGNEDLD